MVTERERLNRTDDTTQSSLPAIFIHHHSSPFSCEMYTDRSVVDVHRLGIEFLESTE